MITNVSARTLDEYNGSVVDTLDIPMAGSQYVIKSIDGLGPVKAEISTVSPQTDAGVEYVSSKTGMRNIVLNIGFDAKDTRITDLRRSLYKVFMPERYIRLDFVTDTLGVKYIYGYVESHEPNIFMSDPVVQISILCPDPYFRGYGEEVTYNLPKTGSDFIINLETDVPVGFVLDATYDIATTLGMTLTKHPYLTYKSLFLSTDILVGDRYIVSTVKGDRYARRVRSSATSNALGYFIGSLVKMVLMPGPNHFSFSGYNLVSSATITYDPLYGGL